MVRKGVWPVTDVRSTLKDPCQNGGTTFSRAQYPGGGACSGTSGGRKDFSASKKYGAKKAGTPFPQGNGVQPGITA